MLAYRKSVMCGEMFLADTQIQGISETHGAWSIEHSVFTLCPLRYALCFKGGEK